MPLTTSQKDALDSYKRKNVLGDLQSLKGTVTVVTGGGTGIGLAITKAILEVGGYAAVIGVSQKADLEELLELEAFSDSKLSYYQGDVADEIGLRRTFDAIIRDFGKINGLVCSAGICIEKPFLEHTWQDAIKLQMVNSIGLFFCAQYAAHAMLKNPRDEFGASRGSIVFISSVVAKSTCESQSLSAYAATKGAVDSLCRNLAVELAPMGIRVNTISPGHTMTHMAVVQWESRPELEAVMKEAPPMGRMGQRRDLKGAAVYFLSDASLYTTGADLMVTGGMHAGRV